MDTSFWAKLKKCALERGRPIMAMAPMANVTDAAFRRMFAEVGGATRNANGENGKPDVFWTEFVSVEGLLSAGREQLLVDFWYTEAERPIVAQIFGDKPEQFEEAARLVRSLGFDGIDINMGCPDRGVEKSGAGAALIRDSERAREIIRATKRGAGCGSGDGADGNAVGGAHIKSDSLAMPSSAPVSTAPCAAANAIPVSVKTRLGYRSLDEMTAWLTALLEEDLAALTVHLRTRNEMSDVPAHWELAPQIVALRDRIAPKTILLGNGDAATLAAAHARAAESGFDGIMVGRGMFGNPWFFNEATGGKAPNLREKLTRMVEHTELYEKLYRSKPPGEKQLKNFDVMKKHFKAYCSGFDGAKELRVRLMETENAAEVRRVTEEFLKKAAQ